MNLIEAISVATNDALQKNYNAINWLDKEATSCVAAFAASQDNIGEILTERNENILHMAAKHDATAIVVALKERKDLMEAVDVDGNTPFHVAASVKNSRVAWLLAWYGAKADVPNNEGVTPKDLIVKNGNTPVRKVLGGPRLDIGILNEDNKGDTDKDFFFTEAYKLLISEMDFSNPADQRQIPNLIIFMSRKKFEKEMVQGLLGKELVMDKPYNGSPTELSVRDLILEKCTDYDAVHLLVDAGVDMNSAGAYDETGACVVARRSDVSDEEFLYKIGKLFSKECIEKVGKKGSNAIHYAAFRSHEGLIKAFMEIGADVSIPRGDVGGTMPAKATALELARKVGYGPVIDLLTAASVTASGGSKGAAISLVKRADQIGIAKTIELLKQCSDINDVDEKGQNAICHADDVEIVKTLLELGIDVDAVDNNGDSMAMVCAYKAFARDTDNGRDIFELLVPYIKNINYRNNKGKTLLYYVTEHFYRSKNLKAALGLFAKNPDKTIGDEEGHTPEQILLEEIKGERNLGKYMTNYLPLLPFVSTDSMLSDIEAAYGSSVVWCNRDEVLKLVSWLDEHREYYEKLDAQGNNLFMIAAKNNCMTLMRAVAERYPDQINAKNLNGKSAFQLVSMYKTYSRTACILLMDDEVLLEDKDNVLFDGPEELARCRSEFDSLGWHSSKAFDFLRGELDSKGYDNKIVINTDYISFAQLIIESWLARKTSDTGSVVQIDIKNISNVLGIFEEEHFDECYDAFAKSGLHLNDIYFKDERICESDRPDEKIVTFADYFIRHNNCALGILKALKAEGVDLGLPNERGYYLSHTIIEGLSASYKVDENQESIREALSMFDADTLNTLDAYGWNALHYSTRARSATLARILVELGADINAVEDHVYKSARKEETKGYTALHLAAKEGSKDIIRTLLELGADQSIADIDGRRPLHAYLLRSGMSDHEVLKLFTQYDIEDDKSTNAIIMAVLSDDTGDNVKMLNELGLDINSSNDDGDTPLIAFCKDANGKVTVIRNLLNIPGIDVNRQNKNGETALMALLKYTSGVTTREKALILLDAGADPEIGDKNGETALTYIIDKEYEELLLHIKEKEVEEVVQETVQETVQEVVQEAVQETEPERVSEPAKPVVQEAVKVAEPARAEAKATVSEHITTEIKEDKKVEIKGADKEMGTKKDIEINEEVKTGATEVPPYAAMFIQQLQTTVNSVNTVINSQTADENMINQMKAAATAMYTTFLTQVGGNAAVKEAMDSIMATIGTGGVAGSADASKAKAESAPEPVSEEVQAKYAEEADKFRENDDVAGLYELASKYNADYPTLVQALLDMQECLRRMEEFQGVLMLFQEIEKLAPLYAFNYVYSMEAARNLERWDYFQAVFSRASERKVRSLGIIYQYLIKENVHPTANEETKLGYVINSMKMFFQKYVLGENATKTEIANFYEKFDVYAPDVSKIEIDEREKLYLGGIYRSLIAIHVNSGDMVRGYMASEVLIRVSELKGEDYYVIARLPFYYALELEKHGYEKEIVAAIQNEALDHYKKAESEGIEISGDDAYFVGKLYGSLKNDIDTAKKYYNKCLDSGKADVGKVLNIIADYIYIIRENKDENLADFASALCDKFRLAFPDEDGSFIYYKSAIAEALGDVDQAMVILDEGMMEIGFNIELFKKYMNLILQKGDYDKFFDAMEDAYEIFEEDDLEDKFPFFSVAINVAEANGYEEVKQLWTERKQDVFGDLIRNVFYFATVILDTGKTSDAYGFINNYPNLLEVLGVDDVEDLSIKQIYKLAGREDFFMARKNGEPFVEEETDATKVAMNAMMQNAVDMIFLHPSKERREEALRQRDILEKMADANNGDACYLYGRTLFGPSCVPGSLKFDEDPEKGFESMLKGIRLDSPLAIVGGFRMCDMMDVEECLENTSYETKLDMFDALYRKALSGDLMSAFVIGHSFFWKDIFYFFDMDMSEEIEHYSALAAAYFYEMLWQAGSDLANGNYERIFSSGKDGIPVDQKMIDHINRR